jgi:hypothetical protein
MSQAAIDFIADNPRATAKEAGLTNAEANALVGRGLLIEVGKRVTGKRGRPPAEYVVAGTDLSDNDYVQQQVEKAQQIVRDHRHFERLSNAVMRAANEYGHGSQQHTDAVLLRRETFLVLPPIPSKNDYILAGEAVDLDDTPLDVPELAEAA